MHKNEKRNEEFNEKYNETSNTVAGINTPKDHEDSGPLDMVSEAVEEIVDNVQHKFDGHPEGLDWQKGKNQ
ncbi:hypothetical protein M3194_05185 [Paenibacillus glycanilyticus]|uniref:hypothetical protein n=1 Tax=Paenibacillus glycanilyticus TaxID=126569 RepID=UPI00203BE64A|nr:hypothetical protein [Paenibacillus glycanilyticus]MCM3626753.1 hypothetical protein [Paenibacillus glycanilyticus]